MTNERNMNNTFHSLAGRNDIQQNDIMQNDIMQNGRYQNDILHSAEWY